MRTEFLSELVGTFVMVFIGCYSIKAGYSPAIISFSFGFAVFIVILTSRKYSGAHINPAVSIAFSITGQLDKKMLMWGGRFESVSVSLCLRLCLYVLVSVCARAYRTKWVECVLIDW